MTSFATTLAVPASAFGYAKVLFVGAVSPRHTTAALLLIGVVRHVVDSGWLAPAGSGGVAAGVHVALLCAAVLLCDAVLVSSGLRRAVAVYSTAAVPISAYVALRLLCKVNPPFVCLFVALLRRCLDCAKP
jgi:hypothetical protein